MCLEPEAVAIACVMPSVSRAQPAATRLAALFASASYSFTPWATPCPASPSGRCQAASLASAPHAPFSMGQQLFLAALPSSYHQLASSRSPGRRPSPSPVHLIRDAHAPQTNNPKPPRLRDGDVVLVVDAGGGTVDITAHAVFRNRGEAIMLEDAAVGTGAGGGLRWQRGAGAAVGARQALSSNGGAESSERLPPHSRQAWWTRAAASPTRPRGGTCARWWAGTASGRGARRGRASGASCVTSKAGLWAPGWMGVRQTMPCAREFGST